MEKDAATEERQVRPGLLVLAAGEKVELLRGKIGLGHSSSTLGFRPVLGDKNAFSCRLLISLKVPLLKMRDASDAEFH